MNFVFSPNLLFLRKAFQFPSLNNFASHRWIHLLWCAYQGYITKRCLSVCLSVQHNGIHLIRFLRHWYESVIGLAHSEHCGCGVQVMTRPPRPTHPACSLSPQIPPSVCSEGTIRQKLYKTPSTLFLWVSTRTVGISSLHQLWPTGAVPTPTDASIPV